MAASYLLQEDGVGRFTLEDGSGFILLEDGTVTVTVSGDGGVGIIQTRLVFNDALLAVTTAVAVAARLRKKRFSVVR